MQPTREDIKAWLKRQPKGSREWLGNQCGVAKKTVDNWLSGQEIPESAMSLISRLMADDRSPEATPADLSQVTLRITTDELNDWSRAFKASDAETLEDWALDAIRAAYEAERGRNRQSAG